MRKPDHLRPVRMPLPLRPRPEAGEQGLVQLRVALVPVPELLLRRELGLDQGRRAVRSPLPLLRLRVRVLREIEDLVGSKTKPTNFGKPHITAGLYLYVSTMERSISI